MAFTLFPMLPPEIRSPIFLLASPGEPRIVPIKYDAPSLSYRPRLKPPAVLSVNRECRHEALKVYHELRLGQRATTGCYIDPSKDSIYLLADIIPSSPHEDRDKIKTAWRPNLVLQNAAAEEFHALQEITPSPSLNEPIPALEAFFRLQHPRTIFRDLIWSPDRDIIFQNFHIDPRTWKMVARFYIYFRQLLPIHFTNLVFVVERNPTQPLQQNYQLEDDSTIGEDQWRLTQAAITDAASREEVMNQFKKNSDEKLRQHRSEAIAFNYMGNYVNQTDQVLGRRPTQPKIKLKYIGMED